MNQKDFCDSLNLDAMPTEYGQALLTLYQLLNLKKKYMAADLSGDSRSILTAKQQGICTGVAMPRALKIRLFSSWKHFGGELTFPIEPTQLVKVRYHEVSQATELTPEVLRYLNLREALLDHCISKLQEIAAALKNSSSTSI